MVVCPKPPETDFQKRKKGQNGQRGGGDTSKKTATRKQDLLEASQNRQNLGGFIFVEIWAILV